MLSALLTGRTEEHLSFNVDNTRLQDEAGAAFLALKKAARNAGFELCVASGFRSYERQLAIWQRKFEKLSTTPVPQRFHQILRWSALPGASRHHWGTDMDIYDPTALAGAQLQLVPEEYLSGGAMAPLLNWLHQHAPKYGFFWPYQEDKGGVAAEPWHLSYRPVAETYLNNMSVEILLQAWKAQPPDGVNELLPYVDELFKRYVINICR